jgi:hypothetical protein
LVENDIIIWDITDKPAARSTQELQYYSYHEEEAGLISKIVGRLTAN